MLDSTCLSTWKSEKDIECLIYLWKYWPKNQCPSTPCMNLLNFLKATRFQSMNSFHSAVRLLNRLLNVLSTQIWFCRHSTWVCFTSSMYKLKSISLHLSRAPWKGMWFKMKNCILFYVLNTRLPQNTQTMLKTTNEFITHLLYSFIDSLFCNLQLKPKQWTKYREPLKHFTSNPTIEVFTWSVPIHLIFCHYLFWTILF